jgi:hypothetical protein
MGMGYAFAVVVVILIGLPILWTAWWLVDGLVEAMGGHPARPDKQVGNSRHPIF